MYIYVYTVALSGQVRLQVGVAALSTNLNYRKILVYNPMYEMDIHVL